MGRNPVKTVDSSHSPLAGRSRTTVWSMQLEGVGSFHMRTEDAESRSGSAQPEASGPLTMHEASSTCR